MSVDILDRVYDAYGGDLGHALMRETQRRIHWMCTRAVGSSVLDMGHSQGLVPILLAREGKSAVGIDGSSAAIRAAEQHLLDEPVAVRKRVSFIEADVLSYDFGEQAFDSVVLGDRLAHVLQPEQLISAAARALAPGGRLVVTVPFGLTELTEQKHTFYLLQPYKLLATSFEVSEVTILGKWLGLVGTRRSQPATAGDGRWDEQLLAELEAAFARVEHDLIQDLATLRIRLDEANVKQRANGDEVSRLKREVAHHDAERRASEAARDQLEAKISELARAEPARELALQRALSEEREARHTRELSLARLEERLANTEQFRQLELGVRDAELARLAQAKLEVELALRQVTERLSAQAEQAERELTAERQEKQRLVQHAEKHERAAAGLEQRLQELNASYDEKVASLRDELAQSATRSATLSEKLEAASSQAHGHAGLILELESRLADAQREALTQAQVLSELEATRARLLQQEAALQARARELDEQSHLGSQRKRHETEQLDQRLALERALEKQRLAQRSLEQRLEQQRQQLLASKQTERKATMLLERERREKSALERTVLQTRNTLSFQLGYHLIHGFKSRQALLQLPRSLWQLQQEAVRRRKQRHDRDLNVSTAAPVQPSTLAPAVAATPVGAPTTFTPPPIERRVPAELAELTRLRVACIHDEFTFAAFEPECRLQQLSPRDFCAQLEAFQPQLLFVESAWRGQGDQWNRKVAHRSQELADIVAWCRARGVPTVFWNKEDPVHFRTFLNTAKLFDVVFTTDTDCIARYKRALGHERVYLLPFAFQPAAHNPIEKYERKDAMCFAGAYYARYPERQQDLASFVSSFSAAPRLEIYDRNHGKSDPDYQFPEDYRPYIVGTLPFDQIDRAYKGYRYALNLNSIKESQTMFARRIFELLGSNTITVSNFSRGVRLMFGDLVITTDHGDRALQRLRDLSSDESRARRFRLAGLRKVLNEHTYGHRLRFVASRVWNQPLGDSLPAVVVLAKAENGSELGTQLANFERQVYANKALLIVAPRALWPIAPSRGNVELVSLEDASNRTLGDAVRQASHVATFSGADYYGPNYLLDLALATRYSSAAAIGKAAHYSAAATESPSLVGDGQQYRACPSLAVRAALIRREVIADFGLGAWLEDLPQRRFDRAAALAIDEFNYCADGSALAAAERAQVDDLPELNHGATLDRLLASSSVIALSEQNSERSAAHIPASKLIGLFRARPGGPISLSADGDQLLVQSSLPDESHEYLYASQAWSPSALGFPASGKFHLDATPGLHLQLALLFLDEQKQRLGHKLCAAGRNETASLPERTAYIQLGLRVYGSGSAKVSALHLDHVRELPDVMLGTSDYLLLTNHYPSDHDLYRNGFVHRRVLEYRRRGTRVDVFRLRAGEKLNYHEFDGVDVINGGVEALATLLRCHRYKAILVHFLDQRMWPLLREEARGARILIWVHGAEIQAWHRRHAHYGSPALLEAAKADSAQRSLFWRDVTRELPPDAKLIFVSRHFAEEVMTDLGVKLPEDRQQVIHNVIDTDLFRYQAKSAEQRKRILSIRPHTSRIYGNDLTVAAIVELSKRPCFAELQFHMVGDGPLFEETVAPLRSMANVQIDRGFLTQSEIANLHRDYGVFLCASRGDTQGVSRDEAMASGLVPVTNRVGAIPEFVDEQSGIVAAPESALELADAVERLYQDPSLFERLSAGAAQRVRRQSAPPLTTDRELQLILGVGRP